MSFILKDYVEINDKKMLIELESNFYIKHFFDHKKNSVFYFKPSYMFVTRETESYLLNNEVLIEFQFDHDDNCSLNLSFSNTLGSDILNEFFKEFILINLKRINEIKSEIIECYFSLKDIFIEDKEKKECIKLNKSSDSLWFELRVKDSRYNINYDVKDNVIFGISGIMGFYSTERTELFLIFHFLNDDVKKTPISNSELFIPYKMSDFPSVVRLKTLFL